MLCYRKSIQHQQAARKGVDLVSPLLIIDPNYENALIVSGNEYVEIKSPKDAIAAYCAAISKFKLSQLPSAKFVELNPLNYRSFFSLGSVYFYWMTSNDQFIFLKTAIKLEYVLVSMVLSYFDFVDFRSEDYRPFELLSECYHNLGFPNMPLIFLTPP